MTIRLMYTLVPNYFLFAVTGYVRQHYLNLFKAESQREKSGVPRIRRGKKKKKKVPHNFFYFSRNLPKFKNARASFETNYFFFFGLIMRYKIQE